jgi:hypothetical protein
MAISA